MIDITETDEVDKMLAMLKNRSFAVKMHKRISSNAAKVKEGQLHGASKMRMALRLLTNLLTVKRYIYIILYVCTYSDLDTNVYTYNDLDTIKYTYTDLDTILCTYSDLDIIVYTCRDLDTIAYIYIDLDTIVYTCSDLNTVMTFSERTETPSLELSLLGDLLLKKDIHELPWFQHVLLDLVIVVNAFLSSESYWEEGVSEPV